MTKHETPKEGAPLPAEVDAPHGRLKEHIVKAAFEKLDWPQLHRHLESLPMRADDLPILLGHLRRTTSLLLRYPDEKREARRAKFSEALSAYLERTLGPEAAAPLSEELALFSAIERGYHGILDALERSEVSKLPPEVRVSASIRRTAYQYGHLIARFEEVIATRREVAWPLGPLVQTEDMAQLHPDAILGALVESLTSILVMEARRNHWIDENGYVVLPALPAVGDDERFKAGVTELLALLWRRWHRTEERRRFLGGMFEQHRAPNLPNWARPETEQVTVYRLRSEEVFDFVANERLNDRLAQMFMEMLLETNVERKATGIVKGIPLLPDAFASPTEAHAAVSLCEILNYDVSRDEERPGGLRFAEWLRGYTVLGEKASERAQQTPGPSGLTSPMSRAELLTALTDCGLPAASASRFVDLATLGQSSGDLFDCPLLRTGDDQMILFGPAVLNANVARVILSRIGTLGDPLARKGRAFEREMLRFFQEQGLRAESFKVTRGGEEYEYDVVLVWGEYVFVFECKSHHLSNRNPARAYYFGLQAASDGKQVRRLAGALQEYPDILQERFEVDLAGKKLVPCILNALPFSLPGSCDGVYFTDASGLKRFFQGRYFHIKTPHRVDENLQVLHRIAMSSLWTGETPAPADLLQHLEDPFQVKLLLAHTEIAAHGFAIGPRDLAASEEFVRTEMTIESFADMLGLSADSIREESAKVSRHVEELRARLGNPET